MLVGMKTIIASLKSKQNFQHRRINEFYHPHQPSKPGFVERCFDQSDDKSSSSPSTSGLNIWRAGTIINISTISHIASFNENHSYVVSI
ncbi:hypothetical protein D0Y65_051232 [Glycine soja]|uniref:Uncharacterized protein n=1 Tax=Glycine soja TaxID=3848 RepID=A0A445FFA5_GLYSO|nr:hypothetical protein D0Y65_051232 [Glycine soja]